MDFRKEFDLQKQKLFLLSKVGNKPDYNWHPLKTLGVDAVVQWVKLVLVMSAPYIQRARFESWLLCFHSCFLLMHRGGQKTMAQ